MYYLGRMCELDGTKYVSLNLKLKLKVMDEPMLDQPLQLIEVEKVIASKSPKLLQRIPKFLIRYLKRIIHQEEINEFLIRNRGKQGIDFINSCLDLLQVHMETAGLENVPKNARLIFVANHPLGGIDGMCLMKAIHENIRPQPRSLSNDLLLNVRPLRALMIGVNKHGGNSREDVAEMQRVFEGDDAVIIFAAGLVSRRRWFRIRDVAWKGTFAKKAFLHERDVIPVHISGRVSGFFYRLANLRKLLRIKQNLEMLYLPNEMFKQKGMKLVLTFGKPIPWRSFDSSCSSEEWAARVRKQVYEMAKSR